jgi:hypothetical protein
MNVRRTSEAHPIVDYCADPCSPKVPSRDRCSARSASEVKAIREQSSLPPPLGIGQNRAILWAEEGMAILHF